ncbi:MAG: hypothetical protein Q8N96_03795 [Methylovulum sp.]|nr:hypothetical protein [Methylovulum sp.]
MKRICVIGNSHIGALIGASHNATAKENFTNKGFILDFYANAGRGIQLIKVEDGALIGIRYASNTINNIYLKIYLKDYDLFLIYCDLHIPNYISRAKKELGSFSKQVIEETIRDRINALHSIRLFKEIKSATSAPVYIASKPVKPTAGKISKDEYIDGINVISKIIQPAIYVEPPLSVLNETFSGNTIFFKDSVNMVGRALSKDKHPKHDMDHMNENGGMELLLHFLDKVGK